MIKYKILVILLFIIFLHTISYVHASNLPLLGKVIYLDPGHGGKDPGAIYNNIKEKDINLEVALKLEKKLSRLGAIVYLTRYGDYDLSVINTNNRKRSDLSRRSNIINEMKPDLYLSIHLNAEDTGLYKGAQVFYTNDNREIARIFQEDFRKTLKSKRKYKKDNNLYMQKRITVPGILVELGFLSNSHERYLLKQNKYQNKVVTSLVNSTVKYFNS